jgi:hypothetical protein
MSNVQNMSLEDIMGDRFGRYSKYIIQERALPDIRDGLKPVQRRILYSMNKDGNTFDKGFRKSAKSVGNVIIIIYINFFFSQKRPPNNSSFLSYKFFQIFAKKNQIE